MSFQMLDDEFDISGFSLIAVVGDSPETGIKIALTASDNYQAQSCFIFTDNTASDNAYLSNIVLSTGEVDTVNPDNSTYKEYELTPNFDKETLDYTVTLQEYIDTMNLEITKDDENSTLVLKIPKRDEDGNLEYDLDGTTILYEEISIQDTSQEITLNELGEADTVITIIVTAEDGETVNEYTITIKRPYATVKGSIIYDTIEESDNPDVVKITDLNFYETGKFNWDELKDVFGTTYEDPATYDDLDLIEKDLYVQSEEDGTYEVYIIPGTYDLQIDKRGFLDYIVTNIEIQEGDTIDLGEITITAGDVDRDCMIGALDVQAIVELLDVTENDPTYEECYDIIQEGSIGAKSLQYCVTNLDELITVINYKEI